MATTTPNFGFDVPTSSDYVKDGALAIETLGDDIDARFGDVTNYPNQIVNRVSGVSRPLPYAISAGRVTISGTSVPTGGNVNATVTYTTSTRFSIAPVVTVAQTSLPGGSALLIPKILVSNTTGFTAYFYNAAATAQTFSNAEISYISIQMTSASATNS
jgi:hypothetical protein